MARFPTEAHPPRKDTWEEMTGLSGCFLSPKPKSVLCDPSVARGFGTPIGHKRPTRWRFAHAGIHHTNELVNTQLPTVSVALSARRAPAKRTTQRARVATDVKAGMSVTKYTSVAKWVKKKQADFRGGTRKFTAIFFTRVTPAGADAERRELTTRSCHETARPCRDNGSPTTGRRIIINERQGWLEFVPMRRFRLHGAYRIAC